MQPAALPVWRRPALLMRCQSPRVQTGLWERKNNQNINTKKGRPGGPRTTTQEVEGAAEAAPREGANFP